MRRARALLAPLRAVVALSGGVDSAVAAWLATQRPDALTVVAAAHMQNWDPAQEDWGAGTGGTPACCARDKDDAAAVAAALGLPLHHCDFSGEYWAGAFEPLAAAVAAGHTANPDVLCNSRVKFAAFADHVRRRFDADVVVTGHYARTARFAAPEALLPDAVWAAAQARPDTELRWAHHRGWRPEGRAVGPAGAALRPARSHRNDQSYFLSAVDGAALHGACFPLGFLSKQHVRALAADHGLPVAAKATSTGICFIGPRPYASFIRSYSDGQGGGQESPEGRPWAAGPVVTHDGTELRGYLPDPRTKRFQAKDEHDKGTKPDKGSGKDTPAKPKAKAASAPIAQHHGLGAYTIGQKVQVWPGPGAAVRHWYVAARRLEAVPPRLVVADRWDHPVLYSSRCRATLLGDSTGVGFWGEWAAQPVPLPLLVSCRYQEEPVPCVVDRDPSGDLRIAFDAPHRAVTPGQVAVFYAPTGDDWCCLGAATILDAA